mgnify:CR=1 FL=1
MKEIRIIILCLILTLVTFGCSNKSDKKPTNLQDTYSAVGNYFGDSSVDRSNLGGFYLDEENNIIVVNLIDNSESKQNEFLEKANIDSKYIKFEQGGPYNTNSLDIDLKVSSENNDKNINFKEYLKFDNRTIYLAENVSELFIVENKKQTSLRKYIINTTRSVNKSIESITNLLNKQSILKDGGTIIFKNKEKNITLIKCNTIDGNKDIYIGDYNLNFKSNMCK